jgi:hypothetical protein
MLYKLKCALCIVGCIVPRALCVFTVFSQSAIDVGKLKYTSWPVLIK